MAELSIKPLQLKKLVARVEEKRKIFDAVNEKALNSDIQEERRQKAPIIPGNPQWYLELVALAKDLPMHNQRILITDEDYRNYFSYLYYNTIILEKYLEEE